jgi:hypothetical protein
MNLDIVTYAIPFLLVGAKTTLLISRSVSSLA